VIVWMDIFFHSEFIAKENYKTIKSY